MLVVEIGCLSDALNKYAHGSLAAGDTTAVVSDIAPTVAAIAACSGFAVENHTPPA